MTANVDWSIFIPATLGGLGQIFVGLTIFWATWTTYRKDRPAQRLSDVESAAAGVVYASGRIMIGLGVLIITASAWRLLVGLLVGGSLTMFVGPFIARRVVRWFWHPSRSIEGIS